MRPAPMRTPRRPSRQRRRRGAFTLIETAMATIIVGVGVLALMEAHQAFLRVNAWSTHTSTATLLANEIRELTRNFPRHDAFSGGLYFENEEENTGFQGWGPEPGEATPDLFDDLDDFDGVVFGDAAASDLPGPISTVDDVPLRFPGPINAFAEVIPDTTWFGAVVTEDGDAAPLQGWTQYVQVRKVDPLDYSVEYANDHFIEPTGNDPGRAVDRFPLRVTVWVLYQGPFDTNARVVARQTWVAPL